MATYKVIKRIKDKQTGEMLRPGQVVELTVKRVTEAEERLGEQYLERLQEEVAEDENTEEEAK